MKRSLLSIASIASMLALAAAASFASPVYGEPPGLAAQSHAAKDVSPIAIAPAQATAAERPALTVKACSKLVRLHVKTPDVVTVNYVARVCTSNLHQAAQLKVYPGGGSGDLTATAPGSRYRT